MTEQKTGGAGEQTHRTRRRVVAAAVLLIVAGAGAYLVWRFFFATPALPASIVAVSGRIEGDDSAVAPKTAGRILEMRLREGDTVKAGDVDRDAGRRAGSCARGRRARRADGGARPAQKSAQRSDRRSATAIGAEPDCWTAKRSSMPMDACVRRKPMWPRLKSDLAQQQAAYRLAAV